MHYMQHAGPVPVIRAEYSSRKRRIGFWILDVSAAE